jgi:2-dehydro-3-deoxyphosphogluconate aldolase/(4S)-4-hydroxy-2-oxoglutarate aldolase
MVGMEAATGTDGHGAGPTGELIRRERFLAIIRTPTRAKARLCAEAARAAGARAIEITFGTPQCVELVTELAAAWPDTAIGVGTTMTPDAVRTAAAAGARFVVSPNVDAEVIRATREAGLVSVPGAATPTEIVSAWRAGATFVKVFPIVTLGGEAYVRLVRGPLPDIPLVVTGGVRLDAVAGLLAAGAVAVGGTNDLFPAELVAAGDRAGLVARAQAFRAAARGPSGAEGSNAMAR